MPSGERVDEPHPRNSSIDLFGSPIKQKPVLYRYPRSRRWANQNPSPPSTSGDLLVGQMWHFDSVFHQSRNFDFVIGIGFQFFRKRPNGKRLRLSWNTTLALSTFHLTVRSKHNMQRRPGSSLLLISFPAGTLDHLCLLYQWIHLISYIFHSNHRTEGHRRQFFRNRKFLWSHCE